MRKLKLEDILNEDFDKYRRVIIFTDNYLEFPRLNHVKYFSLFQMQSVLQDYFDLFDSGELSYLFLFNFPYTGLHDDNFIQII